MRSVLIAALLTLVGCSTIPVDTNQTAIAESRAKEVQACAESSDVTGCMLGIAAIHGGAGGGYVRPPTAAEQAAGVLSALSPFAGAAANVLVNRDNQRTARAQIEASNTRETATVQAIAGLGATIATVDAARAPSVQLGAGAVLSAGAVTQVGHDLQSGDRTNTTVGRDQTGRDHSEDSHDVTTCSAGNGGSGAIGGNAGAGAGDAGTGGAGASGGACTAGH